MENFVVAIDGPAGSGKSSVSKEIAKRLGFTHIDTGAMYRAVTLYALRLGINLDDPNEYKFLDDIEILYKDGKTYLNGEDVSKEIRSEEVTNNASLPARILAVREKMVYFQRESLKIGHVIMDGRDIGTVVAPKANLKVFLTASPEIRAKRRCKENDEKGLESNYEIILKEIIERDKKDSERKISPLKQASDAILVDTSELSMEQVITKIIDLINERLGK